MKRIDGKKISNDILEEIRQRVNHHTAAGKRPPHLVAILVGEDPASQTYVGAKMKACEKVGIQSATEQYPKDLSEARLLDRLREINNAPAIDGVIVQLPLPGHIEERKVIEAVTPEKDVDGFHPVNMGRLAQGLDTFAPATPAGIQQLLIRSGIATEGYHAVVVGRSTTVGTPAALLLSRNQPGGNATVTLCHSRTPNLQQHTQQADILIAAAGKPQLIGPDHLKPGAVVIDVGIHRQPDSSKKRGYRLVGDVDYEAVKARVDAITPVPGGVGPMTIAMLLQNTLKAYENRHG